MPGAFLLAVLLACSGSDDSVPARQYPEHPRLILTGDFLELTRERCRTVHRELFEALAESVDRAVSESAGEMPVRAAGRLAEKCGFLYLINGDSAYYRTGVECLERALERYVELEDSQGGGYWETVEFRRYCAFAYDWLWTGMSDSLRLAFGEKIAQAGTIAWQKKWFTPYGGGGYGTLDPVFWPAVSLVESGVVDSLAGEWLAWTGTSIREWRKMMEQVAMDDGGMYSGMAYAAYNYLRTPIFNFEIWNTLTGEDLTEDNGYLRWFSVWWLYCTKPNGEWPRIDDAGSVLGSIAPWHFKYLASRYRDPVSMWYLENRARKTVSEVWDVIWDPSDLDIPSEGPDSTWPTARHFEGTGWVVMRGGWDEDASHAVFDCGDFYYGHQHAAENSFVIFKRGSLAINSGRYEWGSDHRPNYMARTISSNSMLIYDPDEKFVANSGDEQVNNGPDGRLLSNDGGQLWPRRERTEFGDSEGTPYDTGEITAFETNRWYSYVCGDATRAYSPHKLKSFTRQFLHLQPDLFLLFDRVEAVKADYRKYWLLHSVNEPNLRGREANLVEREGRLFVRSVYPADSRMSKVGGEGKEFLVFGRNYPPSMTHYQPARGEEWGSWRIEITPGKAREKDSFLTLLLAAKKSVRRAPATRALGGEGFQGVEFRYRDRDYRVTFNTGGPVGGAVRISDRSGKVLLEQELTQSVQPQSGIGKQSVEQ